MKNLLKAMRELVEDDTPQAKLFDAMQKDIEEQDANFEQAVEEGRKRREQMRADFERRRRELLDRW